MCVAIITSPLPPRHKAAMQSRRVPVDSTCHPRIFYYLFIVVVSKKILEKGKGGGGVCDVTQCVCMSLPRTNVQLAFRKK